MITLYHGSNMEIDTIDLSKSKKGKDFGCGFYLNANKEQAQHMAERTANRKRSGQPTVTAFDFDETLLKNPDLNVKIFPDYSEEWAEFILLNRRNNTDTPAHPYDIVIGPIANDTVGVQIHRYMLHYITIETLIKELKYRGNHAIQYFFGTEKAIKLLNKVTL